jgi:TetR/AcrR family tetracycline transcriptional repressor
MTQMPLQRESVARAALSLVNEVGLDGLTTRRLAAYLNIQSPSLYWHFANKQALINNMAEIMVSDALADFQPPQASGDWPVWLADYARLVRRMMLAQRDGARILAEADLTLSSFGSSVELVVQALYKVGFTERGALAVLLTVFNFALGSAFEIQAEPSHKEPEENLEENHEKNRNGATRPPAIIDPTRFPTIAHFVDASGIPLTSRDAWFDQGLRLLLDGMRVALDRETERLERLDSSS